VPDGKSDRPATESPEVERLRRENEQLRDDLRRSEAERQRLRRENDKLKEELEAARRAVYRQAAPFSRGTRVRDPRRPGRKAGAAYGPRAHRQPPSHIDETYEARLPRTCPQCHGAVQAVRVATQYQEELPVQRPIVRAFRVHIGACTRCGRRVQGRHPRQTSDALGAAAVQLGPQTVALAGLLNKRFGLPYGKIVALLRDRFGLTVTRGGLVHAVHRAARQAQPTYAALCATVRGSPVVTADETSWRVDADLQWLWALSLIHHLRAHET
jgi:transposase